MLCAHCGAEISAGFKFCPACGTKLDTATIIPNTTPQPTTIKKKPMPIWFKITAFLAVLAFIGVTAGILFTETWWMLSIISLQALREHRYLQKPTTHYTSKEFQAATSFDQFRNFIEAYPVFLNNQSAYFTQRSLSIILEP